MLSAQRELRARELRASGEEAARVDPCPATSETFASRDVSSFAEPSSEAECPMSLDIPVLQVGILGLMHNLPLPYRCLRLHFQSPEAGFRNI